MVTPAAEVKKDAFSFGGFGLEPKKEESEKKEDNTTGTPSTATPGTLGFSLGELDASLAEAQQDQDETPKPAEPAETKGTLDGDVQEVEVPKEVEEDKDEIETPTPAPVAPKVQASLGFGKPPTKTTTSFSFGTPVDEPSQPPSATSSSYSAEIIKKADIPEAEGEENEVVEDLSDQGYDVGEEEFESEEEEGEFVEQEDAELADDNDENDEDEDDSYYDEDEEDESSQDTEADEREPAPDSKRQRGFDGGDDRAGDRSAHVRTPSGAHVREVTQQIEEKAKQATTAPPSFFQNLQKPTTLPTPSSFASKPSETSTPTLAPPTLPEEEPTTPKLPLIQPASLTDTPIRPTARQLGSASAPSASGLASQFVLVYKEIEKQIQEVSIGSSRI